MNESQAMQARNKHIAKVKANIARLTAAVVEFEDYTKDERAWNWVGDWSELVQDSGRIADNAERLADSTYSREA